MPLRPRRGPSRGRGAQETATDPRGLARLPNAELERLPTALLDRAAFGFTTDDIIELPVGQLRIRYFADLDNARAEVTSLAQARKYLVINRRLPIDVMLRNGIFEIEDGHHRYVSALMLGQPTLIAKMQIADNPITALRDRYGRP